MDQSIAQSSKVATVLRVFLFGFYATYISKAFFPAGNEITSLLLTFMTFGAGFLMRPTYLIYRESRVASRARETVA